MSIALDTIIIFLFILVPGIVFRRFYFQGEFTKQFNSKTIGHSIIASVLPGLFIQYLTLNIYTKQWSDIDGETIKTFYGEISKNILPANIFDLEILWKAIVYIILMLLVSWALAILSWGFVRILRMDRWLSILRFRNHWNYYFNGEIKGFKSYKGVIQGTILEVRSDILVRIENEEPRLYSGILRDYTINDKHELEYVYLTKTSIYKRDTSQNQKRSVKMIPGDVFIVSAKDIININIHYITTPNKKRNYETIVNLMWFALIVFIIVSDFYYFRSNTIFKTILLKIFFIIYAAFLGALLRTVVVDSNSKDRNSTILGLVIFILLLSGIYYLLRYVIF